MRLSLLAFAAAAVAAAPAAEVFLFDPAVPNDPDARQVSREVARLILAHRLRDAPDESDPSVPDSVSSNDLDYEVNTYGKPRQSLFSIQRSAREPQLIVLIEGATEDNMRNVHAALNGAGPAFTISEPPTEDANHELVANDFSHYTGPWVGPNSCPFDLAINPREERCWNGDALVVKYDAAKDPETISLLTSSIPQLQQWASIGELETTLVILPESSRIGSIDRWASHPSKLSRRQQETVMEFNAQSSSVPNSSFDPADPADSEPTNWDSDSDDPPSVRVSANPNSGAVVFASGKCFSSRTVCMTDTFGCFRHGTCNESPEGCWKCNCIATTSKKGIKTEWAGHMCQKADVSTVFWMFVGVIILILISVGGGLVMLIGVGNEPLPGVLGAGIVRSK